LLAQATLAQSWYPVTWHRGPAYGNNPLLEMLSLKRPHLERLLFVVPVEINGSTCAAQIDTGVPDTAVWHGEPSQDRARALISIRALDVSAAISIASALRAGVAQCGTRVPVLTLGNAFFEHGTLTLGFAPPAGVSGLIGLAAFSASARLTIDYPARTLTIELAP
jgi:hypothetical protein